MKKRLALIRLVCDKNKKVAFVPSEDQDQLPSLHCPPEETVGPFNPLYTIRFFLLV